MRKSVSVSKAGLAPADQAAELVACDTARLLYAYGMGGVTISAVASAFLVLMVAAPAQTGWMRLWLGAMMAALFLRGLDVLVLHRTRFAKPFEGAREIRRFAVGVYACALLWAVFPPAFFAAMSLPACCGAAVVLAAMAGGCVTVLGPSLRVAIVSCISFLVRPPSCS
jgi:hypothetical protein